MRVAVNWKSAGRPANGAARRSRLRRARANLGDLQLLQALRTYKQAASDGVPGMQDKAREVETMLKEKQGK